jgi:hypothetical protein
MLKRKRAWKINHHKPLALICQPGIAWQRPLHAVLIKIGITRRRPIQMALN